MIKCVGCGVLLQNEDINRDGYVIRDDMNLCSRCFKIKNYSDYKYTNRDNRDYLKIIDDIRNDKALILCLVNVFDMGHLEKINELFGNNILLVLTKRDIMPRSMIDDKIINYFRDKVNFIDIEIISSIKNYNMDSLFSKINRYKNKNKVYVVGYTNAGKSTLINKIIKNYGVDNSDIVTSIYPSTTLDIISINVNENLEMIDTPGIVDEHNMINFVDTDLYKKLLPKNEIKPLIYQVNKTGTFVIDNLIRIEYDASNNANMIFYLSNNLEVIHMSLKNEKLKTKEIFHQEVRNKDVVISGLCFIKILGSVDVKVFCNDDVDVYEREIFVK